MVETNFNPEDYRNNLDQHGLALAFQGMSSDASAEKLAASFSSGKFSSKPVEKIFRVRDDFYVFIWPKHASVNMPIILEVFERFPFCRADSLYKVLNDEKS
jgi:hypothetical protein